MLERKNYDSYNQWVNLFVVCCETVVAGAVYYLYCSLTENNPWNKTMNAPMLQSLLIIVLCYFIAAIQVGVVLYKRKVYAYQIITKVFKNIVGFGILAGLILHMGKFLDAWSLFYFTYLIILFIIMALFRLN